MSCEKFDPECPNCRPCLLDPATGKLLPDTDPAVQTVNRAWDLSPLEEKEAFWRITVRDGRDPQDMRLMEAFWQRVRKLQAAN